MALNTYAFHLGGLIANFHGLELSLRIFLYKALPRPHNASLDADFYSYEVGSFVDENMLTNYDSLGILFKKANLVLKEKNAQLLDESLVDVRNALAHGRISTESEEKPLRLLQYSKPRAGKVKITHNTILTDQWFIENKRRVVEAMMIVQPYIRS